MTSAEAAEAAAAAEPLRFAGGGWFQKTLRALAAAAMLGVMLVISADVVSRYFFAAPITGSYEVVQVLLGLMFFSALPLATRARAHVSISVTDHFLSGWSRGVQDVMMLVLAAFITSAMCVRLWMLAEQLSLTGRTLGALKIPLDKVVFAFSGLGLLTVLVQLLMIVGACRAMWADRERSR